MCLPQGAVVPSRVEVEHVPDVRGGQLLIELHVVGDERRVAAADVEREVRRLPRERRLQPRDLIQDARVGVVGVGADVERLLTGRVGRPEVAAPRLHHGVLARMMGVEDRGAVAAGRESDDGATGAVGDRPVARVDPARQLDGERRLPVPARPPVVVLRVAVLRACPLRDDDDRLPARLLHRRADPRDAPVRGRPGREPVEEVDDRVAERARVVAGRQNDEEVQRRVECVGLERGVDHLGCRRIDNRTARRRARAAAPAPQATASRTATAVRRVLVTTRRLPRFAHGTGRVRSTAAAASSS